MTNRERLFAVLDGKPVDRIPIWLLFPYHRLSCYTDVRTNPCYSSIFEASKDNAVMLDRRFIGASIFAPTVKYRKEETVDNGAKVHRQYMQYRDAVIFSEVREKDGVRTEKKLIRSEDDLRAIAEFPIVTDAAAIHAELDAKLPAYRKEKDEFPSAYGSMMLDLGEPINFIYHSADLLDYPVWSITQHDTVVRFLEKNMERLRVIYRYALEHDMADVYFLVGSELASPPMVSRDTFRQWVLPYTKELIAMVHQYGKKAIVHYHGQIKEILPDFLEMAPDGLHTIEAPPVGNCTLAEAFDVTENKIALIGNIQYDCFRSYGEDEMREAVKNVIDEAAGRRLILSPSAGPYEDAISERMQRNYLAFMKAGSEYGGQ
ncbi:MAG: uroporphyrinogen decarboxylase family protein [Spirochaetota bacterium]